MSEVRKYMSKIYGQEFLNRIKSEEMEERNRRAREEAEQRRKQLELKKQAPQPHESRKRNLKSNEKRPPFMTISEPFQSYRIIKPAQINSN